jgi:class 3 adenylate cyclase
MLKTEAQTITGWLNDLGLVKYADHFAQADVDLDLLHHLNDSDLKELGITSLGHRRKILNALNGKIARSVDPQHAERRFITVLFCDIVGSTALSETVDAEAFSEILNGFHRRVAQVAEKFGGHVAQFLGDGALIYFGSPTPLEDAATCAAHTARQLPAAVRDAAGAGQPDIQVRIGISSGLVVVDAQPTGDWLAVGKTVHLASRLQGQAAPGEVIVSKTTAALLRKQFEVVFLGKHALKGVSEPSELFRIGEELTYDAGGNHFRSLHKTPFVNHTSEIAALQADWHSVCGGDHRALLVTGEAGIGKSRLVAEFIDGCRTNNADVVTYACSPLGTSIPFFAFRKPFQRGASAGDAEALALIEKLDASTFTSQVQRRENRRATIENLAEHLQRSTPSRPRVLMIEDVHWAGPSTIEVLREISKNQSPNLLFIMTSRTNDALKVATGDAQIHHIEVAPLSQQNTRRLVQDWLGDIQDNAALVHSIAQRAGGVPIFAEELANELRLRDDADAFADDAHAAIPSSLQQSLQARIDRLTSGRKLLRLSASMARISPIKILRMLWNEMEPFHVALSELVSAGLAVIISNDGEDSEGLLEIKHQMIRECAYDMILERDRIKIHREIAKLLLSLDEKDLYPATVAEQLERSGDFQQAAIKWEFAGQKAASQSADAEAAVLFRKALALVPKIEDRAWADDFEIDTFLALYPVTIGAQGYVADTFDLQNVLERLVQRGDDAERIMAGIFYQWLRAVVQGDIDFSYEVVQNIPPIMGTANAEILQMVRDRMAGSTLMFMGDFREARLCFDRLLVMYRPEDHAAGLSRFGATDNYTTVLCCLAAIEALDGSPASTKTAMALALESAHENGRVHNICHTLMYGVAFPAIICKDWAQVDDAAQQLDELANLHSLDMWHSMAKLLRGIYLHACRDHKAGDALFDAGDQALAEQGFHFLMPTLRTLREFARSVHVASSANVLDGLERELKAGERWLLPLCRGLR